MTEPILRFHNALRLTGQPARVSPIRAGGHLITLALFPPERSPLGVFPTLVWESNDLPPSIAGLDRNQKVQQRQPVSILGRVRTVDYQVAPALEVRRLLRRARVDDDAARLMSDLLPAALQIRRPAVRQDLVAIMCQTVNGERPPSYQNRVRLAGRVVKAALNRGGRWALTLFVPNGQGRDYPTVMWRGELPFTPEEAQEGPFHTRPRVEIEGQAYTVNYEIAVRQQLAVILGRAGRSEWLDDALRTLGAVADQPAWLVRQEIRACALHLSEPATATAKRLPSVAREAAKRPERSRRAAERPDGEPTTLPAFDDPPAGTNEETEAEDSPHAMVDTDTPEETTAQEVPVIAEEVGA